MNLKLNDFIDSMENDDITIINADVYAGLSYLPDNSIDCAVTSPPYYNQRNYGFEGQIGNESHYSEYIEKLEAVFSLLKDKLTGQGVFFLNIGDKYLNQYGNSKLGMIPYKLAHFMDRNGFKLVDTIVWYKPNHMPSSIKNRFSNTYEPVFVFARDANNYYSNYMDSHPEVPNYFAVNLQPTPYSHVAVYPEKLVEKLLSFGFPYDSKVLDPFAGSGTTAKALLNMNAAGYKMSGIMIEAFHEYVNIIIDRCNLSPKHEVIKLPFLPYQTKKYIPTEWVDTDTYTVNIDCKYDNFFKIFQDKSELKSFLNEMKTFSRELKNNGICYIGIKNWDIDDIVSISDLNEKGWVIRNQLVITEGSSWYPIYLIVKDTKKVRYNFNLDAVRKSHKEMNNQTWNHIDFVGMRVNDNLSKEKQEGVIVKVISYHQDMVPKEVIIKWSNGKFTKEMVKHNGYLKSDFSLHCPLCSEEVKEIPYGQNKVLCRSCNNQLWRDLESLPIINITTEFVHGEVEYDLDQEVNVKSYRRENYNGKFKETDKKNFGASPGARSSTQDVYFTVKRAINVPQEIVGTILKTIATGANLSIDKVTQQFPPQYKHTVSHWFRKDMGGSTPTPEDLIILSKIIPIPDEMIRLLNTRCLSLQSVKKSHLGKNPGDYLHFKTEDEMIDFFNRTMA
ncbi:MAG: DNA methyltransferase [Candidatus Thorarchaeota archaeon]